MSARTYGTESFVNPLFDGVVWKFKTYELTSVAEVVSPNGEDRIVEVIGSQEDLDRLEEMAVGVFFTLYGRMGNGEVEAIADFPTWQDGIDILVKMGVINNRRQP